LVGGGIEQTLLHHLLSQKVSLELQVHRLESGRRSVDGLQSEVILILRGFNLSKVSKLAVDSGGLVVLLLESAEDIRLLQRRIGHLSRINQFVVFVENAQ
jgi:hypothetical protein